MKRGAVCAIQRSVVILKGFITKVGLSATQKLLELLNILMIMVSRVAAPWCFETAKERMVALVQVVNQTYEKYTSEDNSGKHRYVHLVFATRQLDDSRYAIVQNPNE